MTTLHYKKAKELVTFRTGKLDSNAADENGIYPFFTCAQDTYRINTYAFNTECVLLAGNNAGGIFPLKYYRGKFNAYQRTYIIETRNADSLNIKYFYFYLRPLLKAFEQQATGATTKFLTLKILNNIPVAQPDVRSQAKIAAILSAYDDLIENNQRRIALLEKMAEELYREWFVRMRFPGHEQVKIIKGDPVGWEHKCLPEIANITYGNAFDGSRFNSEGRGKPIIRIRNIPESETTDYTDEVVNDKYIVRRGDLLVGMDGEFHINHWQGEEAYLVQRVCKIEAKNPALKSYIAHAIRAPIKHFESILMGATVGHLGAMHLKNITLLVPPAHIQQHLHVLDDLHQQKLLLTKVTRNLSRTRDMLLPRLISGKLSVENLDIQFPPGMQEAA